MRLASLLLQATKFLTSYVLFCRLIMAESEKSYPMDFLEAVRVFWYHGQTPSGSTCLSQTEPAWVGWQGTHKDRACLHLLEGYPQGISAYKAETYFSPFFFFLSLSHSPPRCVSYSFLRRQEKKKKDSVPDCPRWLSYVTFSFLMCTRDLIFNVYSPCKNLTSLVWYPPHSVMRIKQCTNIT